MFCTKRQLVGLCLLLVFLGSVFTPQVSSFFSLQCIPRVAALAVECVSSFAVDFWLQTHLFQAGILWYLLVYLFNYDYTLEESGIQKNEETNQQVTLAQTQIDF
jgi:hypothetical protein